jgi:hypothetical protein
MPQYRGLLGQNAATAACKAGGFASSPPGRAPDRNFRHLPPFSRWWAALALRKNQYRFPPIMA